MAVRGGSWSIGGFKLPEFGLTEKVQSVVRPSAPKTAQGGSNLFGSQLTKAAAPRTAVQGARTQAPAVPSGISSSYGGGGGGSYQQSNQGAGTIQQATAGQPGDGGGGGDGGGYDYIGSLRSAFGQSRSALEGMLPTYDSDFSNFKTGVESGIGRARETLGAQNAQDEVLYGEGLRKNLQTDRDIRQRQQGVFSGLNALDSSAYRDDVLKQDQALNESTQSLESEKRRTYQDRQREFTAFEQEATSKISSYQNEIARAKQGLQQAIASTNMDEAQSIQNYISQLDAQQQQVNSQMQGMAMNLAQLQAQGTDVVGNLGKMNMGAFSQQFGQNLTNRMQSAIGRYSQPQQGANYSGQMGSGLTQDEKNRLIAQGQMPR